MDSDRAQALQEHIATSEIVGAWPGVAVRCAPAPQGQLAASDLLRFEGLDTLHPFLDPPSIEPREGSKSIVHIFANPRFSGVLPPLAAIAWERADGSKYVCRLALAHGEYTGLISPFGREDMVSGSGTVIVVQPLAGGE